MDKSSATELSAAAERRLEEAFEALFRKLDELINTGNVKGARELAAGVIAHLAIESARRPLSEGRSAEAPAGTSSREGS